MKTLMPEKMFDGVFLCCLFLPVWCLLFIGILHVNFDLIVLIPGDSVLIWYLF